MLWLTADQHFSHMGIITLAARPFSSVNEMDEHMIEQWNAVVRRDDEVYHLGDITRDVSKLATILPRLNGNISIIPGNHDRWVKKMDEDNRLSIDLTILPLIVILNHNHTNMWLSHYPLRAWVGSFNGAMHCYGHVHGALNKERLPRSLDVGVDSIGYRPISIEAAWRRLAKDPILPEEERIRNEK